ncbi:MAG: YkoF family thiamine/hydroxymethylpyrimidine-binding protein [Balneolaceae bacterium]|nr:YkoF family thiamine/hydroxymethylpyrimidine-binding protein [Balneolaceae bacterium]
MICELSYLPLATEQYKEDVEGMIDLIKQYDLESEVGELSTTVKGDRDEIMDMIDEVYQTMDDRGKNFRLHVELLSSNN